MNDIAVIKACSSHNNDIRLLVRCLRVVDCTTASSACGNRTGIWMCVTVWYARILKPFPSNKNRRAVYRLFSKNYVWQSHMWRTFKDFAYARIINKQTNKNSGEKTKCYPEWGFLFTFFYLFIRSERYVLWSTAMAMRSSVFFLSLIRFQWSSVFNRTLIIISS